MNNNIKSDTLAAETWRRTVLKQAHDAVVGIDSSGHIIDWNHQAEVLFGWLREKVIGKKLARLILPKELEADRVADIQRIWQTGQGLLNGRMEVDVVHRNGLQFPAELATIPLATDSSALIYLFFRDLSERKRAEQERLHLLQEAQAAQNQLKFISDALPAFVAYIDKDQRYLFNNRKYTEWFGLPNDRLKGLHLNEVLDQETYKMSRPNVEKALQGQSVTYETRLIRDGKVHPIVVTAVPHISKDGQVDGAVVVGQDVTELREAQKANAFSENRFHTLFEQSPLAIQLFALNGDCISANEAWQNLWQVPKEYFKDYNILNDPQLKTEGLLPLIKRAFAGETVSLPAFHYDPNVMGKTGHARWIEAVLYPVKSLDNSISEVALILEDVTERIEAIELQKRMLQQAQFLSEASAVLFSSLDYESTLSKVTELAISHLADWCIIDVADCSGTLQALSIAHKDPTKVKLAYELRKKYPINIESAYGSPKVFRTGLAELYQELTDQDIESISRSSEHLEAMKELGLQSAMVVPLKLNDRILGTITFISTGEYRYDQVTLATAKSIGQKTAIAIENARIYKDAESQRHRFENFLMQAPALITVYRGPDHIIEMTNAEGQRVRNKGDVTGMPLRLASPELIDQGVIALYDEVYRSGQPFSATEFRVELEDAKTGVRREIYVNTLLQPTYDSYGRIDGLINHSVDVTEQVLARKKIEDLAVAAQSANEAKTHFLANMSHEIRTPLAAIMGFTELLKDPDIESKERDDYIEIISRNGRALTQIIDDILDISKVEAGRLKIDNSTFSIKDLVTEVITLLTDSAQRKGLYLNISFTHSTPEELRSDPSRLRQILINIVGNAIKFTQEGGVHLEVDSTLSEDGRQFLLISVKDTGLGIPKDQRSHLFSPFSQADNSMTRKFGGTGLGLALSRRLARALGGDVTLEDCREGHGSTFLIKVQIEPASIHDKPSSPKQNSHFTIGQRSRELPDVNVLLVDDSVDNRNLVHTVLRKHGAQVDLAVNGQEGIEKALKGDHDIILMDIQMPVVDGHQATQILRARRFTQPIIALTAHALIEERDRSLEAGCNDHIPKPIDMTQLVDTIKKYVTMDNTRATSSHYVEATPGTDSASSSGFINLKNKL